MFIRVGYDITLNFPAPTDHDDLLQPERSGWRIPPHIARKPGFSASPGVTENLNQSKRNTLYSRYGSVQTGMADPICCYLWSLFLTAKEQFL